MTPWLLLGGLAWAGEPAKPPTRTVEAELHGDIKAFILTSSPSAWIVAPEIPAELEPFLPDDFDADTLVDQAGLGTDPAAQGIADFRLKGELRLSERVKGVAHHALTLFPAFAVGLGGAGGSSTGVGLTAPELIDLTWTPDTGDQLTVQGRMDRLFVQTSSPGITLTLGRQPISFGAGQFVTPMDVVNPFSPATIDTEYKPGIDAARIDLFAGVSSRLTGVVAWAGADPIHAPQADPAEVSDTILALNGQGTIGVTDIVGLVALARGEPVVGLGVVSGIGPVGINAEATLTVPSETADEDAPFVRAVAGALYRPTATTTVSVEAGYSGAGADDPSGYLAVASGQRASRGEIWQLGQGYAGLLVAQEITPLVSANAAAIVNVLDPSMLLTPGISWSVADNAVVVAGAYVGVGERPDPVPLGLDPTTVAVLAPTEAALSRSVRSEFGLYPAAAFLQLKAYF